MHSITINTKYQDIQGWSVGSEDLTPILCVHGWLDNANSFLPLSSHLSDFRLVSIDLPGHGLSDHKPKNSTYMFGEYVRELVAILRELKWERYYLIGHSMGAAVASLAVGCGLLKPEKLVLIESLGPISNPPDMAPKTLADAIEFALLKKERKETYFPNLDIAGGVRIRAGKMKPESAKILLDRGLEKLESGYKPRRDTRLHSPSYFRYTEEQIIPFCKNILCPTLLILGKDSEFPIAQNFKERRNVIPNLKEIFLEGGHHLHMDEPEYVAKEINSFLKPG